MTDDTTAKLLQALEEIKSLTPEIRLAQLIVNLSYLARGPSPEAPWDAEDEELLVAAQQLLKTLRKGQPVAS